MTDDQVAPVVTAPQAMAAAAAVVAPAQPTTVHHALDSPTVTGAQTRTPSGRSVLPAQPVSVLTSPVIRKSNGNLKAKTIVSRFCDTW